MDIQESVEQVASEKQIILKWTLKGGLIIVELILAWVADKATLFNVFKLKTSTLSWDCSQFYSLMA